jgi:CRP-like cAMP-binding protein
MSSPQPAIAVSTFESRVVRRSFHEKTVPSLPGATQLLADIPPSDYAKILSFGRTIKITRRQTIFFAGDTVKEVLLLTEGCMKITLLSETGGAVILRLVGPGEVIGTVGLTEQMTHSSSAEALASSKVVAWNGATFERLLTEFPTLRRNSINIMERRLAVLEARFRDVSTQQVAQRVARQLLRLLPQVGQRIDGAVEIKLSREDLAQMTGTTLFTVSRLLSSWEEQGIVSLRRLAVVVRNPLGLMGICEFRCDL